MAHTEKSTQNNDVYNAKYTHMLSQVKNAKRVALQHNSQLVIPGNPLWRLREKHTGVWGCWDGRSGSRASEDCSGARAALKECIDTNK